MATFDQRVTTPVYWIHIHLLLPMASMFLIKRLLRELSSSSESTHHHLSEFLSAYSILSV